MTQCVLCNSALALGEIAVMPPRASRWRLGTAWSRWWHAFCSATRALWRALPRWSTMSRTHVNWEAVAWSLLPGMGFIRFGNKLTGQLLLSGWILMLLVFIVGLGAMWGRLCFSAAILLHAAGMLSFLRAELAWHATLIRALFGILLFVGLRFVVYEPACALGRCFYVPMNVNVLLAGRVFENGDSLLYEGRWLRPDTFHRGDIVVYDIHGGAAAGYVLQEGFGLDRIIGVPGDRIGMRDGILLVNDQPLDAAHRPLGTANIWAIKEPFVLGTEQYLIFPSLLQLTMYGNMQNQAQRLLESVSRVDSHNIRGRVALRLHPWSRFGRIG